MKVTIPFMEQDEEFEATCEVSDHDNRLEIQVEILKVECIDPGKNFEIHPDKFEAWQKGMDPSFTWDRLQEDFMDAARDTEERDWDAVGDDQYERSRE